MNMHIRLGRGRDCCSRQNASPFGSLFCDSLLGGDHNETRYGAKRNRAGHTLDWITVPSVLRKVADPKQGGVGFGSQIDKRLKCASRFAVLVTTRLPRSQ
jgi:hypothetical protein